MKTNFAKLLLNIWFVILVIAVAIGVYFSWILPWMNRWGATDAEVNMPLISDGVVPGRVIASTRAVTIHAPASEVWKWVVQLGQDRAGFYSNDWLENLVLSDIHNQAEVRPEWQNRQLGELVPGAGGSIYGHGSVWDTPAYIQGRLLYLWGGIVLVPVDANTTRLLARTYVEPASQPAQLVSALSYDWMHFVMERGMLLGIKARAEATLASNPILDILSLLGWAAGSLGIFLVLFARRRAWIWGLLPLAYAILIVIFTRDAWSAMAGFIWWGVIAAGFIYYGRSWWKGLSLATTVVVSILVLFPQAHLIFGWIFLAIMLGMAAENRAVNRFLPGLVKTSA